LRERGNTPANPLKLLAFPKNRKKEKYTKMLADVPRFSQQNQHPGGCVSHGAQA
jgi:hypothetical protein